MIKTTSLALALSAVCAVSANAGGMSEPVMEPNIIVQEAQTSSSGGAKLPLILFAILVAAAAG